MCKIMASVSFNKIEYLLFLENPNILFTLIFQLGCPLRFNHHIWARKKGKTDKTPKYESGHWRVNTGEAQKESKGSH